MADATQTLRSPYLNLECTPDEKTLVAAMPSGREQLLATIATDTVTGGKGLQEEVVTSCSRSRRLPTTPS